MKENLQNFEKCDTLFQNIKEIHHATDLSNREAGTAAWLSRTTTRKYPMEMSKPTLLIKARTAARRLSRTLATPHLILAILY